ncbi:hypothetical protein CALVIDRAFT_564549 [Calocera viscosa TUFC12733]|uniref:Uncharacterized protein n=1 Tax=Calocera viscosa (strain TUFC12733) TaxID=1330018 RepID=A0A167LAI5_CALVF|nr:hypothetical protein CALVIDRAFT_564549 [Calocera viscosa TUFC12733]
MKFLFAGVVGVAALALQAGAAPLRVDVIVASPAGPLSVEEALKHTDARPNIPVRVSGYGFVSGAGEAVLHPTIQVVEVSNKEPHWVLGPTEDHDGVVMFEGPMLTSEHDEAFRHWVKTHPDVQHSDGDVIRYRPHPNGKKGGCQRSWKHSFNRLTNSLREALGFTPIRPFRPHHQPTSAPRASIVAGDGVAWPFNATPMDGDKDDYLMRPHHPQPLSAPSIVAGDGVAWPFIATPMDGEKDDHVMRQPDARWPMPFHHQGQGRHHRFHHHRGGDWHKKPFSRRIMHALYILGPIEGRIVAFVLGLGIGALIRVVFVMCILAYRAFNGRNRGIMLPEDEESSEPIVVERVVEIREKAPAYTAVVTEGEQTLAPPS